MLWAADAFFRLLPGRDANNLGRQNHDHGQGERDLASG
jgi:hypothetical protein